MASNAAKKKTAAGKKPAASKKSSSTAKSSASKSRGGKTAAAKRESVVIEQRGETTNPLIMKEAALWLVLAVCILIFISYIGFGGYVGEVVADISFGVFGLPAYLFPFLLFIASAFLISNRGSSIAGVKVGASAGLYLCICSFAALFTRQYELESGAAELYERSAAYKTGGGVIGGSICSLLCSALGALGTGIVLLIFMIICMVLITQRSLIRSVKNQGTRMYHSAKESSQRRREAHRLEQQQREEWQMFEDASADVADNTDEYHRKRNRRRGASEPMLLEQQEPSRYSNQGISRMPARDRRAIGQEQYEQMQIAKQQREREAVEAMRSQRGGSTTQAPVTNEPQLDIPIAFPVHKREHRMERRVSGVTMDTRISGRADMVGAEVHEIQPTRTMQVEDTREAESYYIDLEKLEGDAGEITAESRRRRSINAGAVSAENVPGGFEKTEAAADDRIIPAAMDLHIEGIDAEEKQPATYLTEPETEAYEEETAEATSEKTAGIADFGSRRDTKQNESKIQRAPIMIEPEEDEEDWDDDIYMEESVSPVKTSSDPFNIFRTSGDGAPSSAGTVFRDTKTAAGAGKEAAGRADSRASISKRQIKTDTADIQEKEEETAGQTEKAAADGEVPSKRNPRSSEKEIAEGIASVEEEMAKTAEVVKPEYVYPPLDLLKKGKAKSNVGQEQKIRETAAKLQQTLNSFGVHVTVTNVSCGPSVTRYELMPEQGVKVSRIVALADDIKLNLAAADIRIEAPIPGKAAVGIEVPNAENSAVALRDLLESDEFQNHKSKLAFATGKDIGGKVVVSDIAKMPHLLVAGATGSGKSVCMNTIIMSVLYKAHPDEVKLIMIDPKVVELSVYNGIPHLFIPVVTDPKKAAGALNWAVAEMTDRYNKFAEYGVRDLKGYNSKIEALDGIEDENKPKKLPQIVIIVDELADLMMVAPGEVEDAICRLAQLARACGIHLIIATQRPSVNVITGLIKANMPSRIAFSVSSGVDSRTIIDMNGAEKLLGKGDMLFYPQGYTKPARVQGAFVSDEEVADVVDFLKNKNTVAAYNAEMEEQIAKVQLAVSATRGAEDTDALFAEAGKFIIEKDKASIGMLQRVFKIGFNRAARIMDQLSDAGLVGPEEGTKPRKILMSMEQFENYLEEN